MLSILNLIVHEHIMFSHLFRCFTLISILSFPIKRFYSYVVRIILKEIILLEQLKILNDLASSHKEVAEILLRVPVYLSASFSDNM